VACTLFLCLQATWHFKLVGFTSCLESIVNWGKSILLSVLSSKFVKTTKFFSLSYLRENCHFHRWCHFWGSKMFQPFEGTKLFIAIVFALHWLHWLLSLASDHWLQFNQFNDFRSLAPDYWFQITFLRLLESDYCLQITGFSSPAWDQWLQITGFKILDLDNWLQITTFRSLHGSELPASDHNTFKSLPSDHCQVSHHWLQITAKRQMTIFFSRYINFAPLIRFLSFFTCL